MISPFYNEPVNIEKHSQKEILRNSKSNSIPPTEEFKINYRVMSNANWRYMH